MTAPAIGRSSKNVEVQVALRELSSRLPVGIELMKRRLTAVGARASQRLMRSKGNRLTGDRPRFRVWLVDDREQNRTAFYDAQKHHFDIETFSTTGEVLEALKSGVPDALLCDIYFYDDPAQREQIEQWVQGQAAKLREEASMIAPDTAQRGIRLIGDIHKQFQGSPPFPIYAYTSKGPYLLHGDGFQRLEELEARWLFKSRLDAHHERHRLDTDIREFHEQYNVSKWIWQGALRAALVGAIFGIFIDRLLKYLFQW